MVPTVGAGGIGGGLIVVALVAGDVHGPSLVTLHV